MTEVLLERLWDRVGADDDLWVLGDFAFGPRAKDEDWLLALFARLPGARRHLVTGNHDGPLTQALPWDSMGLLVEWPGETAEAQGSGDADGNPGKSASAARLATPGLVLCHYPMLTWPGARKGALQLFGHVHTHWPGSRNAVNVGVDLWDFRPVSPEDAAARARTLPVNRHWSDVEPRTATRRG